MFSAKQYRNKIWKALLGTVISFKIDGLIRFCSEQVVCTLAATNTDKINICLTAPGKKSFFLKEKPRGSGNHLLFLYDVVSNNAL